MCRAMCRQVLHVHSRIVAFLPEKVSGTCKAPSGILGEVGIPLDANNNESVSNSLLVFGHPLK